MRERECRRRGGKQKEKNRKKNKEIKKEVTKKKKYKQSDGKYFSDDIVICFGTDQTNTLPNEIYTMGNNIGITIDNL